MSIDDNPMAAIAARIKEIIAMTPEERRREAASHNAAVWDSESDRYWYSYQDYLDSKEWKDKAERIKWERGGFCQVCHSKVNLNVHHNTYLNIGNEFDTDLIVLCHDCHELFHKNRRLHR